MKIVIDATPKEIVETLGLLESKKNNATTDGCVFRIPTNKPDRATHVASDFSRGMESYSVGLQSQCVGQPTMGVGQPTIAVGWLTFARGDEYGK